MPVGFEADVVSRITDDDHHCGRGHRRPSLSGRGVGARVSSPRPPDPRTLRGHGSGIGIESVGARGIRIGADRRAAGDGEGDFGIDRRVARDADQSVAMPPPRADQPGATCDWDRGIHQSDDGAGCGADRRAASHSEPNAYPGMANKVVGPFAQRVFLAFGSAAASFTSGKVRVVGTPIRKEFLDAVQSEQVALRTPAQRLLIFGGSQGAKAINSAVIEGLSELMTQCPQLTITHQTGEPDHARMVEAYRRAGVAANVMPFLYDMPTAIRNADLVVARAGAMTVAELTACGKPAVLVPLPTAIYDHQTKNAKVMEAAGAALLLPQSGMTGSTLARTVAMIVNDAERLRAMSKASITMRRTDAAEAIVRECYALMGGHHDVNQSLGAA